FAQLLSARGFFHESKCVLQAALDVGVGRKRRIANADHVIYVLHTLLKVFIGNHFCSPLYPLSYPTSMFWPFSGKTRIYAHFCAHLRHMPMSEIYAKWQSRSIA